MAAKDHFRSTLVAPCGIDCAICSAFLRTKNPCPGCAAANHRYRRHCTIASCSQVLKRFRHTCEKFPCSRLKNLDRRYHTRYGVSMLENLEAIRKEGIRAFVRSERERWTCRACGGFIDVHHGRCSACGKGAGMDEPVRIA